MTLDPKKLAEWKRLTEEAAPGPWESGLGYEQGDPGAYVSDGSGRIVVSSDSGPRPCDALFIAAAHEAVPALLVEVDRLSRALSVLTLADGQPAGNAVADLMDEVERLRTIEAAARALRDHRCEACRAGEWCNGMHSALGALSGALGAAV